MHVLLLQLIFSFRLSGTVLKVLLVDDVLDTAALPANHILLYAPLPLIELVAAEAVLQTLITFILIVEHRQVHGGADTVPDRHGFRSSFAFQRPLKDAIVLENGLSVELARCKLLIDPSIQLAGDDEAQVL